MNKPIWCPHILWLPKDFLNPTGARWRHSLHRLVRCVCSLGIRLGWRYWRIQNRALVNPWLVLEWADACEHEAERLDAKSEGLLAVAHRQWAAELRTTYDRWKAPNSELRRAEQ